MALEVVQSQHPEVGPRHGMRVNWGALFCGSFVTVASALFFALLGNAIGLSAINVISPGAAGGLRTFSWIYALLTTVAAFYIGAFCCTRLGRILGVESRMLHGLSCWAISGVSIVVYGILVSVNFRSIMAGTGPDAANWLVLCVSLFGAIVAVRGGYDGGLAAHLYEGREGERVRAA